MGRDKALVPWHGRPLVLVATDALRAAGAAEVVAIGGDEPALTALGGRGVADAHPREGPLGGLLTALRWSPLELVGGLTCDLVAIGPPEVQALVEALAASSTLDAVAPLVDGRVHHLTAAYRRRAATVLQRRFDDGERAVRRAVTDSGLAVLTRSDLDPARL